MPFLYNIPQATDQLSISQADILNNFSILGAIAGNASNASSSLNAASGFNYINLPNNGSIPPVGSSFPAGNIALYASTNPTTSQNELYINKTNQATVVQIPATASSLSITSAPAQFTPGWTYLPSGLLLKWGSQANTNPTNINLNAVGPAYTGLLSAQFSAFNAVVIFFCNISGTTASNLQLVPSGPGGGAFWFTIGY